MGNRNSSIIWVLWVVLMDHPHDTSDELDIGRQGPEWLKDRRYTQVWMVKSLPKHSDLNDVVDTVSAQILEHFLDLVRRHIAVDFTRVQAALCIERTNLSGMVHRAGDSYQLMGGSRLS